MSDDPSKTANSSKDSEISVRIDPDKMQAFIKITPPAGDGKQAVFEDILQALKKSDVTYGIDEAVIRDALLYQRFNEEILAAKGAKAEDGKNGDIKYFYDPAHTSKAEEDAKGNVNFRELGLITNVKKGATLAQIIPATSGVPGTNVTGETVHPLPGKPANLPRGKNTIWHPENPNILIADADGALVFRRGSIIDIEPVYTIQGDVDYNTGNIECIGSLSVLGDVKGGFKIKAGGNVDIAGVVEDAEIEAEGQVALRRGIVGRGKGIVKATGNVYLNYCENQNIVTKGDVIVGEALLHSHVIADGMVTVLGKKGTIIGGEIFASRGIDVRNIGNQQRARTEITVGIHKETQDRFEQIEADIKKNAENLENLKNAIRILSIQKGEKKGLAPDKEALLQKLRAAVESILAIMATAAAEKTNLEKELEKYKSSTIKVKQKIYPGVRIRMQRDVMVINEERSNICFYLNGVVIETRPY